MKHPRLALAVALVLACQKAPPRPGFPPPTTGGTGGEQLDGPAAGEGGAVGTGGAGGAGGRIATAPDAAPDAAADRAVADAPRDARRDLAPVDLPPPAPGCGFATVVTRALFDAIYPPAGRHPLYTYDALVQAAKGFPEFVATGDLNTCRKEAAAFLANVNRETGQLHFADQIAKAPYCQSSDTCPCDPATTDRSKWYYGRGAIQLSWNYNYCRAGADLGVDIAAQPSLVATSSELAWKTALWFWMIGRSGACHAAMTAPGGGGFGQTIMAINGGIECGKGGYGAQEGVTARVRAYLDYARRLGIVDAGTAQDNDC